MATSQLSPESGLLHFNLDMSPEANALLERLAAKTNSNKNDVLARALVLFEVAVDATLQGKKLGIAETDQQLATEITGI